MRNRSVFALLLLLLTGFSRGQQTSPTTIANTADAKPGWVKVYAVGPDVTSPELLPLDLGPFQTKMCGKKIKGKVVLSFLVDKAGNPRNIMFIKPLYNELDKLAQHTVEVDRFKPGTHDGDPVVVSESMELNLKACVEKVKDDESEKSNKLRLMSQPVQTLGTIPQPPEESVILSKTESSSKLPVVSMPGVYNVGGEVKPPVAVNTVNAEFSEEAKSAKYSGICYVSLIVDTQGNPQNVHVERALGMGLDEKAIEAVRQYRFQPAMKNGVPRTSRG